MTSAAADLGAQLLPRHNLPDTLSSFVGRDREIGELAAALARSRLLTLVGAGGIGKTRLALAVAAHVISRFTSGVWFVELASLPNDSLVQQAVVAALGLQEQPGRPLLATLRDALASECTLLVLDNCEHLVTGCAELAEQLLRSCSRLSILATSREPLGITGEVTWRVPSLTVPQPQTITPESLTQYEAVRLFVDRAAAVQPNFHLTTQNAAAVAELCRRMDGIALAIELAAAWVRVLSPEQILARLDDALRLLVGGSRTAPARQQTLRAAIEWSHSLLEEREQRLFHRLGVFVGGWTLEAAEGICADETLPAEDMLGALTTLMDKSLLVAEFQDDASVVRYRLLELMRAYSLEQAMQAGDLARFEQRHRDWFLARAERVAPESLSAEHIAELERDRDNLRAALHWTIAAGDADEGLRLASVLWPVWYVRGHYTEGRGWLAQLLEMSDRGRVTSGRARALALAGHLAYCQGDYAAAEALLERAGSTALQTGDEQTRAIVLQFLGNLARGQGNIDAARELYAGARELNKRLRSPVWEAMSLVGQGQAAADQGCFVDAERFATESLALCRATGHAWGAARSLWILGRIAAGSRDFVKAQHLLRACVASQQQIGDRQGLVWARLDLANAAAGAGDEPLTIESLTAALTVARDLGDRLSIARTLDRIATLATRNAPLVTVRLAAAASALRAALGAAQAGAVSVAVEEATQATRRVLGAHAFDSAWASGHGLSVDESVDEALRVLANLRDSNDAARSHNPGGQPLTRREHEVARLVANGLTDRQIAERLVITEGTAGVHVAHILAKLQFHSRAQIAAWVVEQELQSALRPRSGT